MGGFENRGKPPALSQLLFCTDSSRLCHDPSVALVLSGPVDRIHGALPAPTQDAILLAVAVAVGFSYAQFLFG